SGSGACLPWPALARPPERPRAARAAGDGGGGRAALADELVLCALALRDTLAGVHLVAALDAVTSRGGPHAQAASDSSRAIRDMAFGAVRRLGTLRFLCRRLNTRAPAPLLGALQMAALAELLDGRRPVPVVIDQ